jgi:hypothetical protein
MDERKSEVQLVGAGKSPWDNYNVPYLPKSSSGAGTLAWAAIDSHAGTPAGKSLQVTSPAGVLQFYGWKGAAGGNQVAGDLVVINRAVAGVETAVYIDAKSLSVGSSTYATTAGSAGTVDSIADHQHDELAGLSDDDHPQYVIMTGNGRATNTGDVDVTGNININTGVYKHAAAAGISETREWDDANGKHHSVTISGGIITGWTVA